MKHLILTLSLLLLATEAYSQGGDEEPVVVLYLLQTEPEQKTVDRFWIDWSDVWMGVTEIKRIEGEEAKELIEMFQVMLLPEEAENFCGHSPGYGVAARDENGTVLKSSLCFDCLTWVKPGRRLNIAGEPREKNLLGQRLAEEFEEASE